MNKQKLPIEGRMPGPWEIHYYTKMGKINYFIKSLTKKLHSKSNNQLESNDVDIKIINSATGGDISQNTEIMQYLPYNSLTHEILDDAKKGTPMIRLGDGSQPRVMITAGVHGNELPPQIAAIKIIDELKNAELNGTIYIIPFIAPRATAENTKLFNGENLNLVADSPESLTNKVFKYALKLGIRSLGDFHSTFTHPAEDSVIYYTSIKSSSIAVFVNKKSNSRLLTHIINPGTLITVSNTNNIPTIICEAESPDGTASANSIEVARKQMKAFIEYHRIID
jgi:predicted deacylase